MGGSWMGCGSCTHTPELQWAGKRQDDDDDQDDKEFGAKHKGGVPFPRAERADGNVPASAGPLTRVELPYRVPFCASGRVPPGRSSEGLLRSDFRLAFCFPSAAAAACSVCYFARPAPGCFGD